MGAISVCMPTDFKSRQGVALTTTFNPGLVSNMLADYSLNGGAWVPCFGNNKARPLRGTVQTRLVYLEKTGNADPPAGATLRLRATTSGAVSVANGQFIFNDGLDNPDGLPGAVTNCVVYAISSNNRPTSLPNSALEGAAAFNIVIPGPDALEGYGVLVTDLRILLYRSADGLSNPNVLERLGSGSGNPEVDLAVPEYFSKPVLTGGAEQHETGYYLPSGSQVNLGVLGRLHADERLIPVVVTKLRRATAPYELISTLIVEGTAGQFPG
jgi:hypothetical protein